jgi:hypothetical protein
MTDALIKARIPGTCVLRRPIVFLRVRCSILNLLIKTVRCSIPHCTTLTQDQITNRLHSASDYYHWVQNGWSVCTQYEGRNTFSAFITGFRRILATDVAPTAVDGHVQIVNCFFGLSSYLTHNAILVWMEFITLYSDISTSVCVLPSSTTIFY